MHLLEVIPGSVSEPNKRDNIFIHRQIKSLTKILPDIEQLYGGKGSNPRDMFLLYKEVRRQVSKSHPDVIHCHYATITGAVTLLAAKGTPTIISFGGDEVYGTYKNNNSTLSVRTILARIFSKYCARHASISIVKNGQMADILKKWGCKRVVDVPNGVNLDLFRPMDMHYCREILGLLPDTLYVNFAIRGKDYVKRRDLAEEAISICNKYGNNHYQLLLLENISPDQIPFYLNAGNVLLICSNHEGSPNIVKEALACNRPVVTTDIGDIRQRFNLVNGIFFVHQDPMAIAKSIDQAAQLKQSDGRKFIIGSFSEEKIAQIIVQLYKDLTNDPC